MIIPQRLDINDPHDREWNADLLAGGRRLSVKLNGEEVQRVTAYDVPGQWVERHVIGADGRVVIEGSWNDRHVKVERATGVVTVELTPRMPPELDEK
jgi:hypothetical protein